MGHPWKKLSVPLLLLPLLGLLAYGFTTNPREVPSPLLDRPAPPFTLPLYDAPPTSLAQLQGRPVVLNFWASWCYPACYEEAPALEAAWQAYRAQGVMVLGVDIQDRAADGRAFLQRFALTFPNGPDPGTVAIDYGVYGVPETFFIDRAGRIRYKHVGGLTPALLRAQIEALLGGGEAK